MKLLGPVHFTADYNGPYTHFYSFNATSEHSLVTIPKSLGGEEGHSQGELRGLEHPFALYLVDEVHRTASSHTPLAIPNHKLLLKTA